MKDVMSDEEIQAKVWQMYVALQQGVLSNPALCDRNDTGLLARAVEAVTVYWKWAEYRKRGGK